MSAQQVEDGNIREWRFTDRTGVERTFTGWYLEDVSTERDGVFRWTELYVYQKVTGEYVLRTAGCSVVYHRKNSVCNTGVTQLGRHMDEDMVPCRKCRPGDYKLMDDTEFDVETEISGLQVAKTERELIDALRESEAGGVLSHPAARLLAKLRKSVPAIALELSKPVPL